MRMLLPMISAVLLLTATAFSAEEETSLVEHQIATMLKGSYGRANAQVKLESVPAHLKQQARIKSVSLHKVPDAAGKGLAIVEFEGEDGRPRTSYVPFRVYEKKTLFYVKKALARGNTVMTEDLGSQERVVGESELIYPCDEDEVVGKVLKKNVSAGTVLTNQMLDSPRVIRRGGLVTIVGQSGTLFVKAKGKAEEPGRLGDRIRVKNLSSGREVVGTVADDGTIVVEF